MIKALIHKAITTSSHLDAFNYHLVVEDIIAAAHSEGLNCSNRVAKARSNPRGIASVLEEPNSPRPELELFSLPPLRSPNLGISKALEAIAEGISTAFKLFLRALGH